MKALDWTIDKWLMQGLLTSILTGVGFLVISFTIEYVKRFRKGRQAREQEIFLQRILCGEQVLEWSNGTVRARGKRQSLLGTNRSLPRGQQLFEQYKQAGGFLGVGQGYYGRLAEARRRLAQTIHDKSISANVSRASWCGGPGSKAVHVTSSTSVDDELTSLEWDSGVTVNRDAVPIALPNYLSTTSNENRSQEESGGSNSNNIATKAPRVPGAVGGVRLWSTQQDQGSKEELKSDMAPELGADLCARALREHPHIAPFLRRDVLEAAQKVERDGSHALKRERKTRAKRRFLNGIPKQSEDGAVIKAGEYSGGPVEKAGGYSGGTVAKPVNVGEKSTDSRVRQTVSGEKQSEQGVKQTNIGTVIVKIEKRSEVVNDIKQVKDGPVVKPPRRILRPKADKSLDKIVNNKDDTVEKNPPSVGGLEIAKKGVKKEKSNVSKSKSSNKVRREKSSTGRLEKSNSTISREGSMCTKRETSSTSVRSLPTRQWSPREGSNRSELLAMGSKSHTLGMPVRNRRKSRRDKTPPRKTTKAPLPGTRGATSEDEEKAKNISQTWPGGKARSATTVAREVHYGIVVKRQGTMQGETQEKSTSSSSVDYQITSFEEKIGMTYQYENKVSDVHSTFTRSNFEEENKDAISSSISGYIRKLVFGESVSQQEGSCQSPELGSPPYSPSIGEESFVERGARMLPNSPMTTIEEAPFGSASKSGYDDTYFPNSDNMKTVQDNLFMLGESSVDQEMKTDDEGDGQNTTEQIPANSNTLLEGGSASITGVGHDTFSMTAPVGKNAPQRDKAPGASQLAGRPAKNKLKIPMVGRRKMKRRQASSPPVLMTGSRSRAPSFSQSPGEKGESIGLRRSLSNQGQRSTSKKNLAHLKTPSKKIFKKRELSGIGSGIKSVPNIRRAASNVESRPKQTSAQNIKQSVKPKRSQSVKTRNEVSNQSLNKREESDGSEISKIETFCESTTKLDGNTSNDPHEIESEGSKTLPKGNGSKKTFLSLSQKKTKKTKSFLVKSKLRPKGSPGSESHETKGKVAAKTKSPHRSPEIPKEVKIHDTKPEAEPEPVNRGKTVKRTTEEMIALKKAKEKQKNRLAASKMLDNYNIEVKREEVLGAVVSLVTYHPKNNLEYNQRKIVDQSENNYCVREKRSANEVIENAKVCELTMQTNEQGELHGKSCANQPECGQERKETDKHIKEKCFMSDRFREPRCDSSGSSMEESKHNGSHASARDCSSIEFDTDSESELTYTSKYGRYSLRLHDADNTKKRVDKFKTIIDANGRTSITRPFNLRPSALDQVVKLFGSSRESSEQSKESNMPDQSNNQTQKPPLSPKSFKGSKPSNTSQPCTHGTKPIDSLALDLEMASINTKRQGRSSQRKTFPSEHVIKHDKQGSAQSEVNSKLIAKLHNSYSKRTNGPTLLNGQSSKNNLVSLRSQSNSPAVLSSQKVSIATKKSQRNRSDSPIKRQRPSSSLSANETDSQIENVKGTKTYVLDPKKSPAFLPDKTISGQSVSDVVDSQSSTQQHSSEAKKDNKSNTSGQSKTDVHSDLNEQENNTLQKKHVVNITNGKMSNATKGYTRSQNTQKGQKVIKGDTSSRWKQGPDKTKPVDRLGKEFQSSKGPARKQSNTFVKQDKKDIPVPADQTQDSEGTSQGVVEDFSDGKKSTSRRKLCVNRRSPVKLQELDSVHKIAAVLETPEEARKGDSVGLGTKENHSRREEVKTKNETDSCFSHERDAFLKNPQFKMQAEGESAKQILKDPKFNHTVTQPKPEEVERPAVVFQKLGFNQNNPIKFQKVNLSRKSSLVFRSPSSGSTSSADLKGPPMADDQSGQVGQNTSCLTIGSSGLRENSSHVFGSNASFSVNSFQAACFSDPMPHHPEVKVSNYRLAGEGFRAYRQQRDMSEDDDSG